MLIGLCYTNDTNKGTKAAIKRFATTTTTKTTKKRKKKYTTKTFQEDKLLDMNGNWVFRSDGSHTHTYKTHR